MKIIRACSGKFRVHGFINGLRKLQIFISQTGVVKTRNMEHSWNMSEHEKTKIIFMKKIQKFKIY